jgi:hypothetical protein
MGERVDEVRHCCGRAAGEGLGFGRGIAAYIYTTMPIAECHYVKNWLW